MHDVAELCIGALGTEAARYPLAIRPNPHQNVPGIGHHVAPRDIVCMTLHQP